MRETCTGHPCRSVAAALLDSHQQKTSVRIGFGFYRFHSAALFWRCFWNSSAGADEWWIHSIDAKNAHLKSLLSKLRQTVTTKRVFQRFSSVWSALNPSLRQPIEEPIEEPMKADFVALCKTEIGRLLSLTVSDDTFLSELNETISLIPIIRKSMLSESAPLDDSSSSRWSNAYSAIASLNSQIAKEEF